MSSLASSKSPHQRSWEFDMFVWRNLDDIETTARDSYNEQNIPAHDIFDTMQSVVSRAHAACALVILAIDLPIRTLFLSLNHLGIRLSPSLQP